MAQRMPGDSMLIGGGILGSGRLQLGMILGDPLIVTLNEMVNSDYENLILAHTEASMRCQVTRILTPYFMLGQDQVVL